MTVRGHVHNGVVVLDDPTALPDGAEVSVRQVKQPAGPEGDEGPPMTMYERYKRFIGAAKGLPPDASANIDHYLYGTPKHP